MSCYFVLFYHTLALGFTLTFSVALLPQALCFSLPFSVASLPQASRSHSQLFRFLRLHACILCCFAPWSCMLCACMLHTLNFMIYASDWRLDRLSLCNLSTIVIRDVVSVSHSVIDQPNFEMTVQTIFCFH